MDHRLLATATLSAAMGLALALQAAPASAAQDVPPIVKQNMERMKKQKLEKCYGINAVSKNDCAEGVHSCAGQATTARETKSFVLVPAGVCSKIEGGSTKPS